MGGLLYIVLLYALLVIKNETEDRTNDVFYLSYSFLLSAIPTKVMLRC